MHVVAGCNSACVFCAWQPAIVITVQTENNVQHTTANVLSFVIELKKLEYQTLLAVSSKNRNETKNITKVTYDKYAASE